MLGVMKAGGASVAMDVTQPKECLQQIVQQVQPNIILCSVTCQEIAALLGIKAVLIVDEFHLNQLSTYIFRPLPVIDPYSKLYVVFTSGSTGTPKGIIISHSKFSSAIEYQQEALGFNCNERVLDFASYSFDAAWSNFLHCVSSGGCLCIPSESARKDDIGEVMARMAVTHADLTPSTARILDLASISSLCTHTGG